ncbi:MAG: YicC family protein [Chitinophagaceae bacterium]|jgi:uncharacterized protein (TIGR00255 family)|nr:YicC family protein [Chitinophagaceae bacterium]
MLKSMTGYGRSEQMVGDKLFLVEIRSLNGKQFEVLLKIPQLLKPYEFEIRNMLSEKLVRGSVECIITLKQNGAAKPVSINMELARAYFKPLRELSDELGLDTSHILSTLLKLPEVVNPTTDVLSEDDWSSFQGVLMQAIAAMDTHRLDEGAALEKDLRFRISQIRQFQEEVIRLDPIRKEKIREQMKKALDENIGSGKVDENRLEQELIYYIEKMDVTEEQVRLKNHCDYFLSLLDEEDTAKGKKLSFVLQEIGREINTTGSKAYDAGIQKWVVMMKDELEKAKEQVLNVL